MGLHHSGCPEPQVVCFTRSTHTQAIDEETGKVLGDISGQIRSHGVALVPEFNRGFITDGGGQGAIIIFDLKTYAVLGKIAAMPDADGIIYDAEQKVVLAVSGDGNALMTLKPDIDPGNGKMDVPSSWAAARSFWRPTVWATYISISKTKTGCDGGPEDAQGRRRAGRWRRVDIRWEWRLIRPSTFYLWVPQSAESGDHERRHRHGSGLTAHWKRRGCHQV